MRAASRVALAGCLLSLLGCGSGGGGGGGDDDGGQVASDAAVTRDGASPGPDASTRIVITGLAQTIQGTSAVNLAGASLEAYRKSGGAALATATSAADGNYTLNIDTAGVPFDGYIKGTSSGRLDSYLYFPRALPGNTPNATVLFMSQQTVGLLGLAGGFSQQASKGLLGVAVVTAAGTPVAGATFTIAPAGSAKVVYTANMVPSASATATDTGGAAVIANTDTGEVTVDAIMGATDFQAVTLNARAGAFTSTLLLP
jgi:hypothetical protein